MRVFSFFCLFLFFMLKNINSHLFLTSGYLLVCIIKHKLIFLNYISLQHHICVFHCHHRYNHQGFVWQLYNFHNEYIHMMHQLNLFCNFHNFYCLYKHQRNLEICLWKFYILILNIYYVTRILVCLNLGYQLFLSH